MGIATPLRRRPRDIYDQYAEESRLQQGPSQLELERTQDILSRVLPPPPARVVDVGGAAGVYSAWLAASGYDVRLLDASPRLVAEARRVNATLHEARLPRSTSATPARCPTRAAAPTPCS